MSQIDKFFKSKLEERNFAEDDQSWREMQLLLDEQEDDRPKLGWLFSFLGFAMLSAMVWVNVSATKQDLVTAAAIVDNGQHVVTTTENPFQYLLNKKAKEKTEDQSQSSIEKQTQTQTQAQTQAQAQTQNQTQTKAQTKTRTQTQLKKSIKGQAILQGQAQDVIESSNDTSAQIQSEKQTQVQTTASTPTPIAQSESIKVASSKDIAASNQKDRGLSSISEVSISEALPLEKATDSKTMAMVDLLESKFNFLQLEEKAANDLPGKIIPTKRYQKIRLGLGVEQSVLIPYSAKDQINITAVGPVLQFPINHRWSVFSGLQYKRFTAKTFSRDTIVAEDYSFGLQKSTFTDRVTSLHYLSFQTLLQRKINRFAIGLGLELDALLGTYGELEESRSLYPWELQSGDEELNAVSVAKGALGKSRLNKLLIAPQLQLNYSIARNAELSFGLKYQLADYFENSTALVSSPAALPAWNGQRLQCQLGLNYYFFNWKKEIK